ncbi:dienelactone hydrolase family protein [Tianweitania sp. BSSL-BM11]|uniref:Dienelactone hydrolase family protein n=1 Tax=Tianweitania aestuarii TaxID=2814886 RepID=A0ABS5RUS1_9HYPH|nr:dienelactone hydrolase family protein [Tianweitania aestuarii]MBS9720810.1 dienelactone hydrolase family protein [Tianweitania aestuarii]
MPFSELKIKTADGEAGAWLFRPDTRPETLKTGVIVYMDAFGLRPAMSEIGEILANAGYVTLIPDLFYRNAPYGPFDAKTAFKNEDTAKELRGIMSGTTQAMTISDTAAFLQTLEGEGVTRVGAVGYCMGGPRALNAAAHCPDRIVAAASFHGGNLASDAEDSPHKAANKIKGRVYVGSAGVDKSFPPEQSAKLALALREAEVDHIIENYVGMQHGWAVSDHDIYDPQGAQRAWTRMLTLFNETLDTDASAS